MQSANVPFSINSVLDFAGRRNLSCRFALQTRMNISESQLLANRHSVMSVIFSKKFNYSDSLFHSHYIL